MMKLIVILTLLAALTTAACAQVIAGITIAAPKDITTESAVNIQTESGTLLTTEN